jgi:hypothetical protein
LGFLALYTDRQGNYWFRGAKGFHTALSESLSSLESLADELAGAERQTDTDEVNAAYRRLSALLEV